LIHLFQATQANKPLALDPEELIFMITNKLAGSVIDSYLYGLVGNEKKSVANSVSLGGNTTLKSNLDGPIDDFEFRVYGDRGSITPWHPHAANHQLTVWENACVPYEFAIKKNLGTSVKGNVFQFHGVINPTA
jgi:hypothetical protein